MKAHNRIHIIFWGLYLLGYELVVAVLVRAFA